MLLADAFILRVISVHVSLNDNELLLTPPLYSVFCLFDGVLPSKTKWIHCILRQLSEGWKMLIRDSPSAVVGGAWAVWRHTAHKIKTAW